LNDKLFVQFEIDFTSANVSIGTSANFYFQELRMIANNIVFSN